MAHYLVGPLQGRLNPPMMSSCNVSRSGLQWEREVSHLGLLRPGLLQLAVPHLAEVQGVWYLCWAVGQTRHGERHVVRAHTQPDIASQHIEELSPLGQDSSSPVVDCEVVGTARWQHHHQAPPPLLPHPATSQPRAIGELHVNIRPGHSPPPHRGPSWRGRALQNHPRLEAVCQSEIQTCHAGHDDPASEGEEGDHGEPAGTLAAGQLDTDNTHSAPEKISWNSTCTFQI